jgi:hypothetical protein
MDDLLATTRYDGPPTAKDEYGMPVDPDPYPDEDEAEPEPPSGQPDQEQKAPPASGSVG